MGKIQLVITTDYYLQEIWKGLDLSSWIDSHSPKSSAYFERMTVCGYGISISSSDLCLVLILNNITFFYFIIVLD